MVADIQRLENAARLAMGDFEGPAALPQQTSVLTMRKTGFFMLAMVALVVFIATVVI